MILLLTEIEAPTVPKGVKKHPVISALSSFFENVD